MKNTNTLLLGAVVAAALTATQSTQAADYSTSDSSDHAIFASPRVKEQFPALTRQTSSPIESTSQTSSVLSTIKLNHAFAASPRVREQFPELARGEGFQTVSFTSLDRQNQPAVVIQNNAFAASPRVREQFPHLVRGYSQPVEKTIEIAPLK